MLAYYTRNVHAKILRVYHLLADINKNADNLIEEIANDATLHLIDLNCFLG